MSVDADNRVEMDTVCQVRICGWFFQYQNLCIKKSRGASGIFLKIEILTTRYFLIRKNVLLFIFKIAKNRNFG